MVPRVMAEDQKKFRDLGNRKPGLRMLGATVPKLTDKALRKRGFLESAIVHRWSSIVGEAVAGWVTLRPGASIDEVALKAFCAENLPEEKRPVEIAIVDELPRNDRGKIDRNAIRRLWEDKSG